MARLPLTLIFGCLLACSMVMPASSRAADVAPPENPLVALNRHKLESIIIPKLEFREATLREAIDFLKKKSVELDADSTPGSRGLNIVLKLEADGSATVNPAIPGVAATTGASDNPADRRITLSLTNISLLEALRYVTGLANLKLQIDPDRVYIMSAKTPAGTLITKEWKIPRDLIPGFPPDPAKAAVGHGEPDNKKADRETPKNWLIANGVNFDGAATAVYIVRSSRLIVRNTQDQLDLIDTIINSGQKDEGLLVEIQCRFVEISRSRLKDLKFNSLLGYFNSPATQNVFISGGDVGMPAASGPAAPTWLFEAGQLTGVFTDPQYQLVLRMLTQKIGSDLVSSPTLTLKSGQRTRIEVIREFRDPPMEALEDTPSQIAPPPKSVASPERTSTAAAASPSSPLSLNHQFKIVVEIKPTIGPDGYSVDLDCSSQVSELEGLTEKAQSRPLFSTRFAPGEISIFDGSTLVFNDLLHDDGAKTTGPSGLLVGKVPILGKLHQGDPKEIFPRRLMLFMTARLVNPGSGPIRTEEGLEEHSQPPAPSPLPAK